MSIKNEVKTKVIVVIQNQTFELKQTEASDLYKNLGDALNAREKSTSPFINPPYAPLLSVPVPPWRPNDIC